MADDGAKAEVPDVHIEANKDADAEGASLEDRLLLYQQKSSCTQWNTTTNKYESVKLSAGPKRLGQVTLSVGIELYFRLVKEVGFLFLFMFILSCPMLVFNCAGSMVSTEVALNSALGKASIANIGRCPPQGCRTAQDLEERCVFDGSCGSDGLKVKDVSQWLGLLDGFALLSFVLFGLYFGDFRVKSIVKKFDDLSLTPADYTICVDVLPRRLEEHAKYEERLRAHFVEVLKTMRTPKNAPEDDAVAIDYSDAIHHVTLVREYDGQVADFMSKGNKLLERENLEALKAKYTEAGKTDKADKQQKAIDKVTDQIRKFDEKFAQQEKVKDEDRDVVRAYVTFRKMDYYRKALSEYRFGGYALFRLCQSERLRMEGHRMSIKAAEEPSDLYWENMDFNKYKRVARKALVILVTLLVLILCTLVLVSIKSSTTVATANSYPTWIIQNEPAVDDNASACLKICKWDIFAEGGCAGSNSKDWPVSNLFTSTDSTGSAFSSLDSGTDSWPGTAASCKPIWQSPGCAASGASEDWLGVTFEAEHEVGCMQVIQDAVNPVQHIRVYGCLENAVPALENRTGWAPAAGCIPMQVVVPNTYTVSGETGIDSGNLKITKDSSCNAEVSLEVAQEAKAAGDDVTVNCFCTQELKRDANLIKPPYESPQQIACEKWSKNQAVTYGLMVLGIIGVAVLNQVLLIFFAYVVNLERPQTVSEYTKSQLWKLFLSQLVNTALLTYLVNQKFEDVPAPFNIVTEVLSIGKGAYYEVNGNWFEAVGAALLITILTQVFSTTLTPLVMTQIVTPLMQKFYLWQGTAVTYDALKAIYTPPEWQLSLRLAQTMNVICCVVFYSGGMPLLYLIGCVYCFMAYWLDKYTLIRGSKRPPAYSEDVVEMCMHFFPIAVLLHAIFACFVLSNPDLLPSDWSGLKGFGEGLFGVTEAQYDSIRTAWDVASSAERSKLYEDWISTRFLDFARESTWLLMLIFLVNCAYYILYYLYALLLAPVLEPVVLLVVACFNRCGLCQAKKQVTDETTYEEALASIKKHYMPKNYEMHSNPTYKAAALAIKHSAEKAAECAEA